MTLALIRSVLPASAAFASLVAFSSPAHAAGEDCLRDTECASSELCFGGICTVPETEPATCEAGCEFDEECVDGFCKTEGVTCDNPGGQCWVEQDRGECECFSGDGTGWSDGFNPDDPPQTKTDEELLEQCGSVLVETCGTEGPMLPETCVGDVLTDCESFVELESVAIGDCGEGTPEVTIARVGDCCETFAEPFYADYRECMLEADAPTCALISSCESDGGTGAVDEGNEGDTDGGTDPTGGDTDTDTGASAADEDTSSCSVGGGSRGWILLLGLLAWRRRRD